MTFEEASDMHMLHSISPELTCTCDEYHICQQCYEEYEKERDKEMWMQEIEDQEREEREERERLEALKRYLMAENYVENKENSMATYEGKGNPAFTLAEECAEVIQVITKLYRFNGDWNETPPGKDCTRWEALNAEMNDLLKAWAQLRSQIRGNEEKIKKGTILDK